MYTYFWRSSPYPFLTTFDAPDANVSLHAPRAARIRRCKRSRLANDRGVFETAQGLAARGC